MKHLLTLTVLYLFSIIPSAVHAQERSNTPLIKISRAPELALPIDCTPTKDCWVLNYVDIGSTNDGKNTDHSCGVRTYDGHKGTDKDGTIKRVRDGEKDRWATEADLEETKKQRKECGNAVLIDHGDGLETIYCHMRQGSITVKPKQKVKTGDKIGEVGLSGYTQFPHVHLGVIQDGQIIDPYTGLSHEQECGQKKHTLWKRDINLSYQPLTIQATGLANNVPELNSLLKDMTPPASIPPNSDVLTGWVMIYGTKKGDKITLEIFDPNNRPFNKREITQDRDRARQFYYTGRNLKGVRLAEGVYSITATVTRQVEDEKAPLKWSKTSNLLVVQP